MGIFRRRQRPPEPEPDPEDVVESFAEQESNPELLEAEREVNGLPRQSGGDSIFRW